MHTQAAENILELLPNLVLLPGGKSKSKPSHKIQQEPVPKPKTRARKLEVCKELASLNRVASQDAFEVLSQVQPSSWGFHLWVTDSDTAMDDSAEPTSGIRKVTQVRKPVVHAAPDLLTWLQDNGHTGGIALEFKKMDGHGEALDLFVYIPEAGPKQDQAAVSQSHDLDLIGQFQKLIAENNLVIEQQQKQVLEFVAEHNRQQRAFIVQVAHHIDSIHARETEKDDELRELGLSIFESNLKETQAELIARMTGGIGYIKQKIDDGQRAEEELASLCPPRPQYNETENLFNELFAHFIKAIVPTSKEPSSAEDSKSDSNRDVPVGSEGNSS